MKKVGLMLLLSISAILASAQKENGTVYSEHDAIAKIKAMWAAFVKGDKETFNSFFADSLYCNDNNNNGINYRIAKKDFIEGQFWPEDFFDLTIEEDKPAYPDALEYKDGDIWVHDWIRFKGTHKESGIYLDLPIHSIFHFDKNGKIDLEFDYYNPQIINEIVQSSQTIEAGIIYKNHPFINTSRKLINAYCRKDIESVKSYYSPEVYFSESFEKYNTFKNLETRLKSLTLLMNEYDNIKIVCVNQPVCHHFKTTGNFYVEGYYSLSCKKKDGTIIKNVPINISQKFNSDGKIVFETVNFSSNHFQ